MYDNYGRDSYNPRHMRVSDQFICSEADPKRAEKYQEWKEWVEELELESAKRRKLVVIMCVVLLLLVACSALS